MVVFFQPQGGDPRAPGNFFQDFARSLENSGVGALIAQAMIQNRQWKRESAQRQETIDLKEREVGVAEKGQVLAETEAGNRFLTSHIANLTNPQFMASLTEPAAATMNEMIRQQVPYIKDGPENDFYQIDPVTKKPILSEWAQTRLDLEDRALQAKVEGLELDPIAKKREILKNDLDMLRNFDSMDVLDSNGNTLVGPARESRLREITQVLSDDTIDFNQRTDVLSNLSIRDKSAASKLKDTLTRDLGYTDAEASVYAKKMMAIFPMDKALQDINQVKAYIGYLDAMAGKLNAAEEAAVAGAEYAAGVGAIKSADFRGAASQAGELEAEAGLWTLGMRVGSRSLKGQHEIIASALSNPFDERLRALPTAPPLFTRDAVGQYVPNIDALAEFALSTIPEGEKFYSQYDRKKSSGKVSKEGVEIGREQVLSQVKESYRKMFQAGELQANHGIQLPSGAAWRRGLLNIGPTATGDAPPGEDVGNTRIDSEDISRLDLATGDAPPGGGDPPINALLGITHRPNVDGSPMGTIDISGNDPLGVLMSQQGMAAGLMALANWAMSAPTDEERQRRYEEIRKRTSQGNP